MNTEQSFLKQLLIVIVVFEKNPLDAIALQSLTSIEDEAMLMIYDNSPFPSDVKNKNIIYKHDPSNPGVSKAYNVAGVFARKHNKKWLMLVDQDTQFPDSIFEKYQLALNVFPEIRIFVPFLMDDIGLVSPFTFHRGKGKRIGSIQAEAHELSKFRFANSGLLISADAFELAGGYDEKFPLDYSDIVFEDRLAKVHTHFVLIDSLCRHRFSGSEKIGAPVLLKRFHQFCQAVILYKNTSFTDVPLYWVLLPRAIKLSLQKKNIMFIVEAIRSMRNDVHFSHL